MRIRALYVVVCGLILVSGITAAVPQSISYQGRLMTDSGQPFADSKWMLTFTIYSSAVGGSPLWTETQEVTTKSGLFTAQLGTVTPLPANLFDVSPRYLGIALGSNAEMTPRTPMISVPYALVAGKVSGDPTNCHTCDTVFINNIGPEVFRASVDTALKIIDTGNTARVGLTARIETSTSDTISAIRGVANNSGTGKSQAGSFTAASTGGGVVHGINAQANNNSATYTSMGVVAQAKNDGAGSARGGYFEARTGGTGEHVGVVGQSFSNSSANGFGVKGYSQHDGTGKSYGGYFSAYGGANRYGISSFANSNSADTAFGVYSLVQSTSNGLAFAGFFQADSSGTGTKYGLYCTIPGGTVRSYGLRAETDITSSDPSEGTFARAWNRGTGLSLGGNFAAYAQSGKAYGSAFLAQAFEGVGYGLYSRAYGTTGSDTLFGVYSDATSSFASPFGGASFSGYFLNSVEDGGSTLGLYTLVSQADGTNAAYGIYSRSQQISSAANYGGYFLADSAGTGVSYGIRPVALSKGTAAAYGVQCAVANRSTGSVYAGYFDVLNYGTGARYAVYGNSPISGYAGYFNGDVRVIGDQTVLGTKSAAVEVAPEEYRLVYSQESPECWFEDFGEGELVNGRAHVDLDPGFLQTVTIDQQNQMKVFIQLNDPDCNGTAVVRGTTGFDVVELMNGGGSASFSYRVVAKRKGYESVRLARMDGGTPRQVTEQVETNNRQLQVDENEMEHVHLLLKQNRGQRGEEAELMPGGN